jgi:hypothetical protein
VLKITPNQWVSRTFSYIKNELLPAQWVENRVVPRKKNILHLSLRGSYVYENKRGTTSDGINFFGKIHFNTHPAEFAAVIQMLSQPQ